MKRNQHILEADVIEILESKHDITVDEFEASNIIDEVLSDYTLDQSVKKEDDESNLIDLISENIESILVLIS